MNKKDYILKLLDLLKDTRPMAEGIRILVEGNALDEQGIDAIISIIKNALASIQEDMTKEKLEKSMDFLQRLQEKEAESHLQDEKDIQELDVLLAQI